MISASNATKPNLFIFLHDGVQFGPCTVLDLKQQVAAGLLRENDLVWQTGAKCQRRAGSIGWLFSTSGETESVTHDSTFTPSHLDKHTNGCSGEQLESQKRFKNENHQVSLLSSCFDFYARCSKLSGIQKEGALRAAICATRLKLAVFFGGSLILLLIICGSFLRTQDTSRDGWGSQAALALGPAMSQLQGFERQFSAQQDETRRKKEVEDARQRNATEELLKKSTALLASDMPHAARECLEQGLELTPNHTASHVAMAELSKSQGEHAKANDSLWKAVSSANGDIRTQLDLLTRISADCFNLGNFHGSIKAMEHAIRLKPEEGAYRYTAGVACLNADDARRAVSYFEAALEYFRLAGQTGAWEFKALCQLAIAHRRLGATQKAMELCEEVLQRDTQNLDARCIRGLMYAEDNIPGLAVKDLQFAVAHTGCSLETAIAFAEAFRKNKQWEPALIAIRKACLLNRRDARLTYWRGMFSLLTGHHEEAAADARLAMQLEPEDEKLKAEIVQLSSTAGTLISRGITLDQLIDEEARAEAKWWELVNSRSRSSGASSGYSSGSGDYSGSYITPRNAGRLGVLGIHAIPGQHAHHFGQ